jgi:hypothetical protein
VIEPVGIAEAGRVDGLQTREGVAVGLVSGRNGGFAEIAPAVVVACVAEIGRELGGFGEPSLPILGEQGGQGGAGIGIGGSDRARCRGLAGDEAQQGKTKAECAKWHHGRLTDRDAAL